MHLRWFAISSLIFIQSCGGRSAPDAPSTPDEPDVTPTTFSVDAIFILVGNEPSDTSILSTNQAHPDITSFTGNYVSAENINANEIRTVHLIDTPFLDFRAQNAYSYAVPFFRPQTLPGSTSGTLYQGWVEELKSMHPGVPLLISETGLSISPNAIHQGPPNYGYGGNTEAEQAAGILQNLADIPSASISVAGVTIHEYLDAWFPRAPGIRRNPDRCTCRLEQIGRLKAAAQA